MARKYAYFNQSRFGWATETCEEKVLIACYENIRSRIPENTFWKSDFEDHFYRHGSGVADTYLQRINAECHRLNQPTVDIVETEVYEYGKSYDKAFKVSRRLHWLSEFRELDKAQKLRFRLDAEVEISRLPPARQTLESLMVGRSMLPADHLSARERAMRSQALETVSATGTAPSIERALRQLQLSTNPDVKAKIVAKQTPDDALKLAELIAEPDIKDLLISRSLED